LNGTNKNGLCRSLLQHASGQEPDLQADELLLRGTQTSQASQAQEKRQEVFVFEDFSLTYKELVAFLIGPMNRILVKNALLHALEQEQKRNGAIPFGAQYIKNR
jgi:hypothetical protein